MVRSTKLLNQKNGIHLVNFKINLAFAVFSKSLHTRVNQNSIVYF